MADTELTPRQLDRAIGAVLGGAVGDALGAGFEFGPPLADDAAVEPLGGGSFGWGPGEWTDDTQQASAIVRAGSGGQFAEAAVADALLTWFRDGPVDIGRQTREVLALASSGGGAALSGAARQFQVGHPDAAGNGSLMRTGPVALTALSDVDLVARRAARLSAFTHPHPDCVAACVLWSVAIHSLVVRRSGGPPAEGWPALLEQGLDWVDEADQTRWRRYIADGPTRPARVFAAGNGWVVDAFRQVVSVLASTPVPPGPAGPRHLSDCLLALVRGGGDTDTVAAIAGAMLGAAWGVTAIPARWRLDLHGDVPGVRTVVRLTGAELETQVRLLVAKGHPDKQGWPAVASLSQHYRMVENARRRTVTVEPGVVFGTVGSLSHVLEAAASPFTVVSLCRVGLDDVPFPHMHLPVALLDDDQANANLPFVLADIADLVEQRRSAAEPVYVHCVNGETRAPAVLATYLARHRGRAPETALGHAERAFQTRLRPTFRQAVAAAAGLVLS